MTANPADEGNDWILNTSWKWKHLLAVQWPVRDLSVEWNVSFPTSLLYYSGALQFESWFRGPVAESQPKHLGFCKVTAWDINSLLGSEEGKKKEWAVILRPHQPTLIIFFHHCHHWMLYTFFHYQTAPAVNLLPSVCFCQDLNCFRSFSGWHSSLLPHFLLFPLTFSTSPPASQNFLGVQSAFLLSNHCCLLLPRSSY